VWFGKAAGTPKDQLQKLADLPPQQQFVGMAKFAGLDGWAAAHGVPAAKSGQCLANLKSVDQLVQMTSDATEQHPDFQGTPTFLINGGLVKDTGTWSQLEPQLKAALGG
jgi:protein-disulfide isomerase